MDELSDLDFIKTSLEDIGEFTEEFITVYTITASSGTSSSLEPTTITYGSREEKATVRRLSTPEISESGGVYQSDDLRVIMRGSWSQDDKIIYSTGTYKAVEKVQNDYLIDDIKWQAVVRRAV